MGNAKDPTHFNTLVIAWGGIETYPYEGTMSSAFLTKTQKLERGES